MSNNSVSSFISNLLFLCLRSALKAIETHRVCSRKRKAKIVTPMKSDLPAERLGYRQPPFLTVLEKRWGFLFTFLTTRAIHVELVSSILKIMCNGYRALDYLDDQWNEHCRRRKIDSSVHQKLERRSPLLLVHRSIKWKYNPTRAPYKGGAWERMVHTCKRVIYATLGPRKLTDEILKTTLCLVEGSFNARPLTPISDDSGILEALTPNHFLSGHSLMLRSLKSS